MTIWKLAAGSVCVAALALSGTAVAATGQQISVNGAGSANVPNGASTAQQQAAYDQALAAAITDAQTKARAVAQQLSLTLGPVQTFTEQSYDYLGYCGFAVFAGAPAAAGVGTATPRAPSGASGANLTPIPAKHRHHKHKKRARKANSAENTCQIQAEATVVYAAG
jgi:Protein of unknown function (DUF541)